MSNQRGQASVEVVAAVPLLVIAGLVALQLGLTGFTLHLADGAAEAGALAVSAGLPPAPAARGALPGWARERVAVRATGGSVAVTLQPPAPIAPLADALTVTSHAWARPAR